MPSVLKHRCRPRRFPDGKTSEELANELIALLIQFQADHPGVSLAIAGRRGWWWHRYGMLADDPMTYEGIIGSRPTKRGPGD